MSDLFVGDAQPDSGPVECLGQTFPSEQARRVYISKLLAEKLKDHEFRKIGSFPSARTKPCWQCRTRLSRRMPATHPPGSGLRKSGPH